MEFNRVRKPPGGDTNDIFHIEERQRFQRDNPNAPTPSKLIESFAPIDMKRVRKPPGGDTNDIFGMESRQKSDALKLRLQQQIREQKEDPTPVVSNQPPQINELDKENLINPDDDPVCDEDSNLKSKLRDEDDKELSSMKYYRHNTITGEVKEMNVQTRLQLKDCSNVPELEEKSSVPRSNIRVRQPPGGTSNIFF